MSDKPTLEEMQANARAKRAALQSKREQHGMIAGSPGTLGDGDTNNSLGGNITKPIRVEGLDDS